MGSGPGGIRVEGRGVDQLSGGVCALLLGLVGWSDFLFLWRVSGFLEKVTSSKSFGGMFLSGSTCR